MSPAKVTLSPKERELVLDAGWILTKNQVIGKVYELFGQLSEVYRAELEKHSLVTMQEVDFRSPKIAKGEQYEGLPWVMLDYPRHFSGTDTLAIRSFFWWGNFCSITLQLSGHFLEKHATVIQQYYNSNEEACKDWYIGTGTDPWQHHFREGNYQLLEEWKGGSFLQLPFLKLAKLIPLQQWDQLPIFFRKNYSAILNMLSAV